MMNQEGYNDQNIPFVTKLLQKFIFNKFTSTISTKEIYLSNVRTLHFTNKKLEHEKYILYFHSGGYVAGAPETHWGKAELDLAHHH